jgi:hypothetical protein
MNANTNANTTPLEEQDTTYFVTLSVCVTLEGPRTEHTREVIRENVMDRLEAGDAADLDTIEVVGESAPVPADPEEMNNDRATWAEAALTAFMRETGVDPEDAICDLIVDLRHLCDRQAARFGTFADAVRRANSHYRTETAEEVQR